MERKKNLERSKSFFEIIAHDTLTYCLSHFLCFPSVWNLRRTCKGGFQLSEYIHSKGFFVKRLKLKLQEMGLQTERFCKFLYQSKSLVSGSFLLSGLVGTYWPTQDLDIFSPWNFGDPMWSGIPFHLGDSMWNGIPEKELICHGEFTQELATQCVAAGGSPYTIVDPDQFFLPERQNPNSEYNLLQLRSLPFFYFPLIRIQQNIIRQGQSFDDTSTWILKTFDFDFLKNTFDGHSLIIYYPENLASRFSFYSSSKNNIYQRILKYKTRGFSFQETPHVLDSSSFTTTTTTTSTTGSFEEEKRSL